MLKISIAFIFGLSIVIFLICDAIGLQFVTFTDTFSSFSVSIILLLLFYCIIHVILNFNLTRKIGLPTSQILFLPSNLIPLILVLLNILPISWSIFDRQFKHQLAVSKYLDNTVLLISLSSTLLLIGMIFGKHMILSRAPKKYFLSRKLDLFLSAKKADRYLNILIAISLIIFPFIFNFRFDLFLEGGRDELAKSSSSKILEILAALSNIVTTILTILSGILYSKSNNKKALLIPFIDSLPKIMRLSRGFYLPLIYFIVAASLMGKPLKKWIYYSSFPLIIIGTMVTFTARAVSNGGLLGMVSGIEHTHLEILPTLRGFISGNSNIGIISNVFAFRDSSQGFLDGFFTWIVAISPIPSFLIPLPISTIDKLAGIGSVTLPMPVFGEFYFLMGWLGTAILFLIGFWIGRVEGNIILHTRVYGKPYWPHVLICLSMIYGVIVSFHSGIRSCSRPLFYAIVLIWLLENIANFVINKYNQQKFSIFEVQSVELN